jgi:hypothetical protein
MLQTFKINAVSAVVNPESKKTSYAINLNFEGKELTLWRTENQFEQDCKRSGLGSDLSTLSVASLINGTIQTDIIKVNAGDKYSVEVVDDNGDATIEEREYKSDGLQVVDGFLSIDKSLNSQIAAAVAEKMATLNNF